MSAALGEAVSRAEGRALLEARRPNAEDLLVELLSRGDALPTLLAGCDGAPPLATLDAELARATSGSETTCVPLGALLGDADREREARGDADLTLSHVLLALSQSPHGAAAEALRRAGLTHGKLLAAHGGARQAGHISEKSQGPREVASRPPLPPLSLPFTTDLTALATRGEIDPVVGRDPLIARTIEILARRTKNHPLLLGEPGVGKTAIVEGLAQRIADGKVPPFLGRCRLLALDLGGLVAGARHRGDLEERLQHLLRALESAAGEIILFIDEAHLLAAAGAAEGAIAVGGLLKPALARGRLPCIGATTIAEYRRHVEKDGALERRFQPVFVDEPTPESARAILEALRPRYAAHHGVAIEDAALDAAVSLTRRYVPLRQLPDKAIDALDEAAARVRLSDGATSGPAGGIVGADAVAEVVERWTGVPVSRLKAPERERLAQLASSLSARVVGQPQAVASVAAAVRRARAGLRDGKRPIGSFLFVGPPGVGKTALARALAEALFDDEAALVRLDMTEFVEQHAVSRLVGAPPGYLGHESGGQLTEAVRLRPYSVILLDEIDRAHPDLFGTLHQLLDEGRLTDGQGRTADFREAVVVMTSNLGAQAILDGAKRWPADEREVRAAVDRELRGRMRPEFLDRLDEVVLFAPLGAEELGQVAQMRIDEAALLAAAQGITLTFDASVAAHLAATVTDSAEGARSLRRTVEHRIANPLADELLSGALSAGDTVHVKVDGAGAIVFAKVPRPSS